MVRTRASFRRVLAAKNYQQNQLLKIDLDAVYDEIVLRVQEEIVRAQTSATARAKQYAPVRKVFKGSHKITTARYSRFLTRTEAKAEKAARIRLNKQERVAAAASGRAPRLLAENIPEIRQVRTLRQPVRGRRAAVPTNPGLRGRPMRITQPFGDADRSGDMRHRRITRSRTGIFYQNSGGGELNARGRYELNRAHLSPYKGGAAYTTYTEDETTGRLRPTTTLGGRLRGEIFAKPIEIDGPHIEGRVVSPTYYARFVEFGTRHAAAQPFLRPALADVRETYRRNIARALVHHRVQRRIT